MDKHLKRIHLVSRHFGELQGLRMALFGSASTLVFGTYVAAPPAEGQGAIWIALAAAFGLTAACQRFVRHYYDSTFGRVSPNRSNHGPLSGWSGAALGFLMVLSGLAAKLPPSAAGLPFIAGLSLWIVIRDWPFRTYHLVGFAAALSGTFLLMTPAAAAAPDASVAAAFLLLGVACVPVGFFDHRLLVSVMRETAMPDAAAEPDDGPGTRS